MVATKRSSERRRLAKKRGFWPSPTIVERLESRTLLNNAAPVTTGADFFGQLAGWISISASGDASGATDTADIQNALNEVGAPGFSSTIYLNPGKYFINQTLVFRGKSECTITGADPATTIIQWSGPASNTTGQAMLIFVGNTICQVNRITLDGQNQIDDGILDGYRPVQLVTNALGTLSNTGASGFYGTSFTTQNAPVKILGIQRWIPANTTTTQSHILELVDAATNTVIFSGTLSAGYVGGTGHFSGVGFSGDITLAPNHTYYLLSQEFNGGDPWYDDTTSFSPDHVLVRSINGSVDDGGGTLHIVTAGQHSFGPVNFVEDQSAATGDAEKFPTNNAFADDRILNFQGTAQAPGHGFTAGIFARQASETLLERDTFSNCGTNTGNVIGTGGGVYLFGQNTIDWWVRDCEFDHDSVGIVTNFGGYAMDVEDCIFNSDSLVDLYLPMGYSTAVRDSTSINSNQFIQGQSSADIIQNDLILDPSSTTLAPISLPAGVQLTLLDTTIRNNPAYAGPDVVVGADSDILAAGNTFAVPNASVASYDPYSEGNQGLLRTLDSQNASLSSQPIVNLAPQTLPGAPVQMPWTPIEVVPTGTAKTDVADINNAIAAAKASIDAGATGAVIHLQDRNASGAFTAFSINSTIVVPAGYPIEFVGDGEAWSTGLPGTALTWSGATGGTILDLGGATLGVAAGPSCATISNLGLLSSNTAGDGIRVEDADQTGGSVYADDALVGVSGNPSAVEYTQNGVFADGLSSTNVQLLDFQADGATNVNVVGGGTTSITGGNVGVFMGSGSSEAVQYSVSNGGKLLVEDQYLEEDSGLTNQWAHADNGSYTVQGAVIKANVAGVDAGNPPISLTGSSSVSVLSASSAAGIIVEPGATGNLLAAGNGQWGSVSGNVNEMGPFDGPLDYAPQSQVALVENGNTPDQINANIPDANSFLRQMLAQTRDFHAGLLSETRNLTATDVRLFNINVTGAVNDIHLVGSAPIVVPDLPPAPTTPAAPTNVAAFPSGAGGNQIDVNFTPGGAHLVIPNANLFNAHSMPVVNNYTGLVGTRFTTGAKPVLVTQLGRGVAGGDNQSHTLEIVRVSDLSVIAQASLQTSSAQANQFAYVSLAAPVVLAPNTSYYLVSSETGGGDPYIAGCGVQSTSIVQSIDGQVKYDTTNGWQPNLNGYDEVGAVDFIATPLPDMAGQGITSGVRTGSLAAGIGNYEGLRFSTGPNPVGVTYLGRWIPASTTTAQAHTLELVDASTGNVIASTTLVAGQLGGTGGQFEYAPLATSVTLAANHSYYLVSFEFTSGDSVATFDQMRSSNLVVGIDGYVTYSGSAWNFTARPGFVQEPLDFLGQVDTSPVSYTIYRSTSADMSGATAVAASLNTTSFIDTTAAGGMQYYYTVAGVNQSGTGATLGEASAGRGTALPTGFNDIDIGTPPIAGSAWTAGGSPTTFNVQGSGTQSAGQWNYVYENAPTGSSFIATVKLSSLSQYGGSISGYDEYRGALMIRDGLGTTAHTAYVDVSATFMQWDGVYGAAEPMPITFELQANYNPANKTYTVTGYYLNALGQLVEPATSIGNPATFVNPANLYVGLAADSNGAAGVTTAAFADFSVVAENFAVLSGSSLRVNLSSAGAVTLAGSGGSFTVSQNGQQVSFMNVSAVTVSDLGTGDSLITSGTFTLAVSGANAATLSVSSGSLTFAPPRPSRWAHCPSRPARWSQCLRQPAIHR